MHSTLELVLKNSTFLDTVHSVPVRDDNDMSLYTRVSVILKRNLDKNSGFVYLL